MFTVFLFGVVFGTLGSIPVAGPISALVVTRGIQGRFRAANYIALGGALPEAVYAFLVFWGFSNFVDDYPLVQPERYFSEIKDAGLSAADTRGICGLNAVRLLKL